MLVADCHNNKNKIQISPHDPKTAFLILFCVVRTQKLRHLISSLGLISHLLFRFIVSFSLLWSYTWYGDWGKKVFHLIVSKPFSTPAESSCSWLLCGEIPCDGMTGGVALLFSGVSTAFPLYFLVFLWMETIANC